LTPLVYSELRLLAARYLRDEKTGCTLEPTLLVHEAYLKLSSSQVVSFHGRTHFLATAARSMRQILIDHARSRRRLKRGGGGCRVTLSEALYSDPVDPREAEIEALEAALEELATIDPRAASIVECYTFAGMKQEEIAEYLGVSRRTVQLDWVHARAWLRRRLTSDAG
jgi:RNA polymerase sigma factor (TIGR02999 family)